MEDLSNGGGQFLPSSSRGMAGGSFPDGPSENFPVVFSANNEIGENGEAPAAAPSKSASLTGSLAERWLDEASSNPEAGASSAMGNVPQPGIGTSGSDPSERDWRSFDEGVLLENQESSHSDMPRASRDEAGPSHEEWMLAKQTFCALLERHCERYFEDGLLPPEYPQVQGGEDSKSLAILVAKNLDVDDLSASELNELSCNHFRTYSQSRSFLKSFLEAYSASRAVGNEER